MGAFRMGCGAQRATIVLRRTSDAPNRADGPDHGPRAKALPMAPCRNEPEVWAERYGGLA